MNIEDTPLDGVKILTPRRFGDDRGWFSETWSATAMEAAGLGTPFVQDNQSFSARRGTVRGLHAQAPPAAQGKLVRVLSGAVLDVAVDARRGSPTFGQWTGVELSAQNGRQLLIPEGFLHAFQTLTADCMVFYKCSRGYAPRTEVSVRFDDPDLAIDWPIPPEEAIVSDKDGAAPSWRDFRTPFRFTEAP